ncbi:uncharacterized protein [Ptychodera flava]|uniref:uncharacterized protein n=1 Tax=Ptychodera flava TaxID=63121 RepID=UPI00396AA406
MVTCSELASYTRVLAGLLMFSTLGEVDGIICSHRRGSRGGLFYFYCTGNAGCCGKSCCPSSHRTSSGLTFEWYIWFIIAIAIVVTVAKIVWCLGCKLNNVRKNNARDVYRRNPEIAIVSVNNLPARHAYSNDGFVSTDLTCIPPPYSEESKPPPTYAEVMTSQHREHVDLVQTQSGSGGYSRQLDAGVCTSSETGNFGNT